MRRICTLCFVLGALFVASMQGARAEVTDPAIPLAAVAQIKTLRHKSANIDATAQYPVFRADTPIARFASWQARLYAEKRYREFLKGAQETMRSFREMGHQPVAPMEFELKTVLWNYQPHQLISLNFEVYDYSGGAHPNSFKVPLNIGMRGDRPAQLVLGDLFHPKNDYRERINKALMTRLQKTGRATWIDEGSLKALTTEQLNSFVLTRNNVWWLFDPYEIGPYVVGSFEIKLTPQEMGNGFRHSLLAPLKKSK